jgi:hypothetical protein
MDARDIPIARAVTDAGIPIACMVADVADWREIRRTKITTHFFPYA